MILESLYQNVPVVRVDVTFRGVAVAMIHCMTSAAEYMSLPYARSRSTATMCAWLKHSGAAHPSGASASRFLTADKGEAEIRYFSYILDVRISLDRKIRILSGWMSA